MKGDKVPQQYRSRVRATALFVDFDNIYTGLSNLDPALAQRFAQTPDEWVERLVTVDGEFPDRRRFLIKACYLNPSKFRGFRPFFARAGFRVIDCPSLTQQGKSAADISLALGAIDALNAVHVYYDEFVFASADADFTPLAVRCREAGRFVTVIAAGPAASAYRSVADVTIPADQLFSTARENDEADGDAVPEMEEADEPPLRVSKAAAVAVRRAMLTSSQPMSMGAAASVAMEADPGIVGRKWDGYKRFTEWVKVALSDLRISPVSPGVIWDPKRHTQRDVNRVAAKLGTSDSPDRSTLIGRVVTLTDVPRLTAERYRRMLEGLALDLREHEFNRVETTKRVRDGLESSGPVGRKAVNFVIQGLLLGGGSEALAPGTSAAALAGGWVDAVIGLCEGVPMELSESDKAEIRRWAGGGLV